MISIAKDKKSATYIITKTDKEGYHRQMHVSEEEMEELKGLIIENLTKTAYPQTLPQGGEVDKNEKR